MNDKTIKRVYPFSLFYVIYNYRILSYIFNRHRVTSHSVCACVRVCVCVKLQ